MFLYVYDMFNILLSCDSLRDLWNVCMYVITQKKVYNIQNTAKIWNQEKYTFV
jgi:hypothetical protein